MITTTDTIPTTARQAAILMAAQLWTQAANRRLVAEMTGNQASVARARKLEQAAHDAYLSLVALK